MLVFDAHLDLSMNALEYNRDLRLPVEELRKSEKGMSDLRGRAQSSVAFPEMRKGEVGICVATIIAGCVKPPLPVVSWNSPEQAHAMVRAQISWYRAMEQEGHLRQLKSAGDILKHKREWQSDPENTPMGYLLSLEGADSIRHLDDLEHLVEKDGLVALGPAHFGQGIYSAGHNLSGPLTARGRELVTKMDELGLILDVTHLSEPAFWEALDLFEGKVWASHHNCRSIVDHPRQLTDEQIIELAARDAVIGASFDLWMTVPGWDRETGDRRKTSLSLLVDHIDHISQITGSSKHCGIGSDLDGGFGADQCPFDVETIADVQLLAKLLSEKGYSENEITGVMHGNFVRLLTGESDLPQ